MKEIEITRYLLDEIEERNNDLLRGYCGDRALIHSNARTIRRLSLKIVKEAEAWNFKGKNS